mmetsp:Transcript_41316/g.43230  ORF Transcript_41316/g.43230 Transcript_41316/m.43230 type:complete len:219 (+) Transcript_41316:12-668(+)
MASLKNVKLTYFGINAAATLPRMLLHYGKIPFENKMIKPEQWPELKPKVEFNFLPQLEVDGRNYAQSHAINTYIARHLDLMGQNIEEEYQINSVLNCSADLGVHYYKVFMSRDEKDLSPEGKKENLAAAIAKIESIYGTLEARYSKLGNKKYYLGDRISVADFHFATMGLFHFGSVGKELLEKPTKRIAPNLSKLSERIITEDVKSFVESDLAIKNSI